MTQRIHCAILALATAATLGAAPDAQAQAKGDWLLKLGANKITPHVNSGEMSAPAKPGIKGDVGPDTKPVLTIGYMLSDQLSAEVLLGVPYEHKLYGAGSVEGIGQIGTSEVLPPTAFLHYRLFGPAATVRPYLGLGYSYVYFQKETGSAQMTSMMNPGGPPSTYTLDSKHTLCLALGVSAKLGERLFADLMLVKSKLKTSAHFNSGQQLPIKIDPTAISLALGYRF